MSKIISLNEKDIKVNMELGTLDFNQEELDNKVSAIEKRYKGLVIADEDIKGAKTDRANLNKLKTAFDRQRIDTVNEFKKPTEVFEKNMKIFAKRVEELRVNIDSQIKAYEQELKDKKNAEVEAHFEELKEKHNLDFIHYENANLNITLSASVKSLKEEVNNYIDKINTDLTLINSQEHKERILVAYKRTLNASDAIVSVNEAVKEEERLKALKEEQEAQKAQETTPEPIVEAYEAPKVEAPQELISITFTVIDTKENIIKVREFMKNNNINYR